MVIQDFGQRYFYSSPLQYRKTSGPEIRVDDDRSADGNCYLGRDHNPSGLAKNGNSTLGKSFAMILRCV